MLLLKAWVLTICMYIFFYVSSLEGIKGFTSGYVSSLVGIKGLTGGCHSAKFWMLSE